jgi:hypothetical protein
MVKLSKSGVIGGALLGFLCLFNSEKSYAASVTCQFLSGTTYSTSGEWVKKHDDIVAIFKMFGQEGLKLPLKTAVLGNLDAKKIFLAGETAHGKIYLLGDEGGVSGKAIKVEGNLMTIYNGMCTVGFGD